MPRVSSASSSFFAGNGSRESSCNAGGKLGPELLKDIHCRLDLLLRSAIAAISELRPAQKGKLVVLCGLHDVPNALSTFVSQAPTERTNFLMLLGFAVRIAGLTLDPHSK